MNCVSTSKWYMWSHHTQECAWLLCLLLCLEIPSLSAPQARSHSFPRCSTNYLRSDLYITNSPCTLLYHTVEYFLRFSPLQFSDGFISHFTNLSDKQKPNLNMKISASNPCCTRLNTASAGGNISLHSPVSVAQPPMAGWSLGKSGKMHILHRDSEPSPMSS